MALTFNWHMLMGLAELIDGLGQSERKHVH
jgi:hypothetical protein